MASFFTDGFGSGLISGGLGLISNAINNKRQKQAEQRQFNYQKELMSIENQQNIDFWNMNNEYNTPANQRARLEAAGLNPNLMYGNGATTTPATMPQASKGNAPGTGYSPIEGERMFLNAVQSANYRANTENALADADLKRQEALTEQAKRDLMATEKLINIAEENGMKLDNEYMERNMETALKQQIAKLDNIEADTDVKNFSIDAKRIQLDNDTRMTNAKIWDIIRNDSMRTEQKKQIVAQTLATNLINDFRIKHYGFAPGEMDPWKYLMGVGTDVITKWEAIITDKLNEGDDEPKKFSSLFWKYLKQGAKYAIENGLYSIP